MTSTAVPSTDPSDLLRNAQDIDRFVGSTANTFTDRLGISHKTLKGIDADATAQVSALITEKGASADSQITSLISSKSASADSQITTLIAAKDAAINAAAAGVLAQSTVKASAASASATAASGSAEAAAGSASAASASSASAEADANAAQASAAVAAAAASATGIVAIYATKAAADASVGSIASGAYVEVVVDETRGGARTRYSKSGGALAFALEIDAARVTQYGQSTATTVQALLRGETTTAPAKRGFWPNAIGGANVHRLKDRLMVGDGADSSGWMADAQGGVVVNGADGANWAARDSVGFFGSRIGLMALTGFAINDDMDTGSGKPGETIGAAGFVINRLAAKKAWGLYSDVQHESTGGSSYGLEVAAKNKAENNSSTPYYNPPGVFGIWLAGGGDNTYGGDPSNPCDTAMAVVRNTSTWNKGIVFKANALTGSDGTNGTATAIEMAKGHQVRWLTPSNVLGALMRSDTVTSGRGTQTIFGDGGFTLLSAAGTETYLTVYGDASAANSVRMRARTSGIPAMVEAIGETNAALELRSSGLGTVNMAPGGVVQAQFATNGGATNFWEFKGGGAAGVQVNAQGASTDVPMVFSAKGAGYHRFFTGGAFGAEQFNILHAAGAVNQVAVVGATTGNAPTLSAQGADSDVDLRLAAKGAGNIRFGTYTAIADAPITGYVQIKDAAGNIRKLAVIA